MKTIAGALLWCFAMLVISLALAELIHPRPNPKPIPLPVTVVAETWSAVEAKGDRWTPPEATQQLRAELADQPTTVRTVRVVPLFQPAVSAPKFEPVPEPVVAQTEFPSLPKPKVTAPSGQHTAPSGGDVCARHGMKRVEYDGGKRWRCAKK